MYTVNHNAEKLFYQIRDLSNKVKNDLQSLSGIVQNSGIEISEEDVTEWRNKVDTTVENFNNEMAQIQCRLNECIIKQ